MGIIVRNYGLLDPIEWEEGEHKHYGITVEPLIWDDKCFEQLYLQNKFWNTLVEIDNNSREAYRKVIGDDPAVNELASRISSINADISELKEQVNSIRKSTSSKVSVATKPIDEIIKKKTAEKSALQKELKPLKDQAKARITSASDVLKEINDDRLLKIKEARNSSGLYWGNYNAVAANYDTARVRAMKEGANLKFHKFDGSGRLTNWLKESQAITSEKYCSCDNLVSNIKLISGGEFEELSGKCPPADRLQSVGSRKQSRQYGIFSVTLFTKKELGKVPVLQKLRFPIILHQPLPEHGHIKVVTVSRRKVGVDFKWSVTLTFSTNEVVPVCGSDLQCGINVGWKQVDGGLRVASITGGDKVEHVVLPDRIIGKLNYLDNTIKSQIDTATNSNYEWAKEVLKNQDMPEDLKYAFDKIVRSKVPHPKKFAILIATWRKTPEFMSLELAAGDERRKVSKLLQKHYAHGREKVLASRKDFYRCLAKRLAETYGTIVMDKMDLREMAMLEKTDGTVNELVGVARRNRVLACLSEFKVCLKNATAKTGTVIKEVAIRSTQDCLLCGGQMEWDSGTVWHCQNCGAYKDTDENAAGNLLKCA